jgi:chorismate lyase / 3-hydroxybenzoate synthase
MLTSTFVAVPARLPADTLACIAFGAGAPPDDDPRRVQVALEPLAGATFNGTGACELWRAEGPIASGREGGFAYARSPAVLFGHIAFDGHEAFAAAVQDAYARIVAFCERQDFPHLLRCWNYFGDIHAGDGDTERYRQFCVGRHRALALVSGFEQRLPAATVIGTREHGAHVYFLAAREPGLQVENPRQVPAFRYPRSYSPLPPSFSRALLKRWNGAGERGEQLFVSGTASVVGHESHHPDDTAAQLRETLANLQALQDAADPDGGGPWRAASLKAYVRRPEELPQVREALAQAFGAQAPLLILQGDICRTDLRVEIEGLYVR